jgi:hypothetical protein
MPHAAAPAASRRLWPSRAVSSRSQNAFGSKLATRCGGLTISVPRAVLLSITVVESSSSSLPPQEASKANEINAEAMRVGVFMRTR